MSQKFTILFDLDGTLVDTAPDLMLAHNHVMRKSLTGSWGQSLGQESYITGDLVLNRTCTQVDPEWDLSNMSVIAFVSNSDTYEVLQAEEISLLD